MKYFTALVVLLLKEGGQIFRCVTYMFVIYSIVTIVFTVFYEIHFRKTRKKTPGSSRL